MNFAVGIQEEINYLSCAGSISSGSLKLNAYNTIDERNQQKLGLNNHVGSGKPRSRSCLLFVYNRPQDELSNSFIFAEIPCTTGTVCPALGC